MGTQSLVALDTDHIKQYVFATDKLKEIRGASSILDRLNRYVMGKVAGEPKFGARKVYANGGSGLFLIDGDKMLAREFGLRIQRAYREQTHDGASITFVVQELPPEIQSPQEAWEKEIPETLALLRYRLAERKVSRLPDREDEEAEQAGEKRDRSAEFIALPSHPFMYTCDACGLRYAEKNDLSEQAEGIEHYYCAVCQEKREEDRKIKEEKSIETLLLARKNNSEIANNRNQPFAWKKVIEAFPPYKEYPIPPDTKRSEDFNEFRGLSGGSKGYLALIYADGNGMGQILEKLSTLAEIHDTAKAIDEAIYQAISTAISQHLPIVPGEGNKPARFPFDILLVGGDDTMLVTTAASALDIAITIAQTFHKETRECDPEKKGFTLSVGVVLAPVKYPFGMLHDLVEDTLQAAKKEETKKGQAERSQSSKYKETRINFMTVTGSTSQKFGEVYKSLHSKRKDKEFYATLRPYTVEELKLMLATIRKGKKEDLGRTKLHQVREAVLKMNLTTSVYEGLSVLRNWRSKQRDFIMQHVYTLGGRYQEHYRDDNQPGTLFPRVNFPWFADGPDTYRTSLLDFVELYDFVGPEGGVNENRPRADRV